MPEAERTDMESWVRGHWPGGDPGEVSLEPMPVDGSDRLFVRAAAAGGSLVFLDGGGNRAEMASWLYFAAHLGAHGLPVPRVLAADRDLGRVLMEDLGRRSLHELARERAGDADALFDLYDPVLAVLSRLQATGAQGLDEKACFDGPRLSPEFLRRREAGYFMDEFVHGACGLRQADLPPGLERELDRLADLAGNAQPQGLVHRDFNSRNILVRPAGQGPGLVDFQGARLGPAQYDLASLLHDPYVDLPWDLRTRLLDRYMERRAHIAPLDLGDFQDGWPFVSLSRVMQALGAYAFLTRRKGRVHFAVHVGPALKTWRRLLREPALVSFISLAALAAMLPPEPDPSLFRPPATE
jgi:hypothetical protein